MSKRIFLILTALLTLSLILLVVNMLVNSSRPNGFKRTYLAEIQRPFKHFNSRDELYRIIGIQSGKVLIQGNSSEKMLVLGDSGISQHTLFKLAETWKGARIFYDSPCFTLASGITKGIVRKYADTGNEQYFPLTDQIYSRSCLVGKNKIVLRTVDNINRDQYFLLRTINDSAVIVNKRITKQYHDGGIVSDGALFYCPGLNKIVYIYYHKGAFLTLDTNLNNQSEHPTIDTFRYFHHSSLNQGLFAKFSNPKASFESINGPAAVDNGYLFITSTFDADNEAAIKLKPHYNIDIYNLRTNAYCGSVVVPELAGTHLRSIWVHNSVLYLVYPYSVLLFRLSVNPGYLSDK